jgi:hypothetical protein
VINSRWRVVVNRRIRLLPVASLIGCYSYQPITPAALPVGTEVRARITGAASDRVGPLIGSLDTRVLVGSVVENTGASMTLEVPTGGAPNVTAEVVRLHARVPLAPSDLVTLEQRKLDVGRTWLLGGGIAAGLGLGVALALRAAADPQPGKLPTDPPPINRIPILQIRF